MSMNKYRLISNVVRSLQAVCGILVFPLFLYSAATNNAVLLGVSIFFAFIFICILLLISVCRTSFDKLIEEEDRRLWARKKQKMLRQAEALSLVRNCSLEDIFIERFKAVLCKGPVSKDLEFLDYSYAVEWVGECASYKSRCAVVDSLFYLAEKGRLGLTSLGVYKKFHLKNTEKRSFDLRYNELVKEADFFARRRAWLKSKLDVAVCRLVNALLDIKGNNLKYNQVKLRKELSKIDNVAALRFDDDCSSDRSMSVTDAAESVFVSLPYNKCKSLVRLLFEIATDGGAGIGEKNLLMLILAQMNLKENDVELLIRNYGLRGESHKSQKTSADQLKECYALLDVEEGASVQQIQEAYHRMALLYHPDLPRNANRLQECQSLMAKINAAYAQLVVK